MVSPFLLPLPVPFSLHLILVSPPHCPLTLWAKSILTMILWLPVPCQALAHSEVYWQREDEDDQGGTGSTLPMFQAEEKKLITGICLTATCTTLAFYFPTWEEYQHVRCRRTNVRVNKEKTRFCTLHCAGSLPPLLGSRDTKGIGT